MHEASLHAAIALLLFFWVITANWQHIGSLIGLFDKDTHLMLSKTFRVSEGLGLEFRAEVFNVSNTPPLNDPNGSFGSAAFGTITSAGNPRDFEFAAKIRY